jgi:hypothetical protein
MRRVFTFAAILLMVLLLEPERISPSAVALSVPSPVNPLALVTCTVTDDFEDGSLSEWTQFATSGCSCPWSVVTPSSGSKYAAVTSICGGMAFPESVMVREDCSYSDCYVECTIRAFGDGSACATSNAGGPVLRAGSTDTDPLIAVSLHTGGVRVAVWMISCNACADVVYLNNNWPLAVGDRVRVELADDEMTIIHEPASGTPNQTIQFSDSQMVGSGYCALRVAHHSSGTGFDDYESGTLP